MKANMRLKVLATLAMIGVAATAQAWWWTSDDKVDQKPITELSWEELIPEGFSPVKNPLDNMSKEQVDKLFDGSEKSNKEIAEIEEMMNYAPVVKHLNGQRVKLPG